MTLKNLALGTTALIGVGLLGGVSALPAAAAEVKPGGALDITITGFARFEAGGGEQDHLNLDDSFSRGLDFRNDTEVHVLARGKSEQTGLEYGGTIEFEADTNSTLNTDESWVYLRGGWGELRMGDEDGAVDNSIIGVDKKTGEQKLHSTRNDLVAFASNPKGNLIFAATSGGQVLGIKPVTKPGAVGQVVKIELEFEPVAMAK